MKKAVVLGFLILAGLCAWVVVFTLKFKLERFNVPAYPARTASLSQILGYYQTELAKQGMNVHIQITDETGLDEPHDVRGIAGNGYVCLSAISRAFDTEFECGVFRRITIGGVGSKSARIDDSLSQRRGSKGGLTSSAVLSTFEHGFRDDVV
jgi:hypothetical protein